MRINEILMRPGSFTLPLVDDCPGYILQALRDALATYDSTSDSWTPVNDAQIVVFDTDVPTDIVDLSFARYAGILREQTGVRTFGGPGLPGYMQTDDGLGFIALTTTTVAAQSLTDWVTDAGVTNGLTAGTVTTTGLGNVGMEWAVGVGKREMFDAVCQRMGAEWRVNPDGTLDAGKPEYLFTVDPTLMVTDQPSGHLGAVEGINGNVTSPTIDVSGVTSQVVVVGTGEGSGVVIESSSVLDVGKKLDGVDLIHRRSVNAPADDSTNSAAIAASTLALFSTARTGFGVTSNTPNIRTRVQPGDNVYVYFPDAGIRSSNLVTFRGEPVFPQVVRVSQINWGVHDGHGVFLRRRDGSTITWLRLTDWVDWADTGAFWKIGTNEIVDRNALAGVARLGTDGSQIPSVHAAIEERALR